jgi:NAD+ kinase
MIKRVGLIAWPHTDVLPLVSHLKEAQLEVVTSPGDLSKVDLLIVMGGDGLLLRTVASLSFPNPPILGINGGNRGALLRFTLAQALSIDLDNLKLVKIPVWEAIVTDGFQKRRASFINETVISRGNPARKIFLKVDLGGYSYTVSGDGLIVATASGSSAYAYDTGGPIVYSSLPILTLVSISMNSPKAVVIKDDQTITIELTAKNNPIFLTVDGREMLALTYQDKVTFAKLAELTLVDNQQSNIATVIGKLL